MLLLLICFFVVFVYCSSFVFSFSSCSSILFLFCVLLPRLFCRFHSCLYSSSYFLFILLIFVLKCVSLFVFVNNRAGNYYNHVHTYIVGLPKLMKLRDDSMKLREPLKLHTHRFHRGSKQCSLYQTNGTVLNHCTYLTN